MLENIEWGEFKIGDLFDVKTTKSFDEGKLKLYSYKNENLIEFVGRTEVNNGIKGYIEKLDVEPNNENLISVSQIGTIIAQIRRNKWYSSQNIFSLTPKENDKRLISLLILSAINKTLTGKYETGYSKYPTLEKLKNDKIKLPICKDRQINFSFMEKFIAELEASHLAELEASHLAELEAYLTVSNLKNYKLTEEEEKVLEEFENGKIEWAEFKIEFFFDVCSYKKRFDANKVTILENGKPYITRTAFNNGLRGFINEDEKYLNEGNTISFGQDTATMFYQEKPYFTGDKIKILKPKNKKLKKENALFFINSMSKSFKSFSWGGSSFNEEIIKKQICRIPIKNEKPNYEIMETFISAIQKLVIKDVVLYSDRRIKATKEITKN